MKASESRGRFLSLYGGAGRCAQEACKLHYDSYILDMDHHSSNDLTNSSVHTGVSFILENRLVDYLGIELVCNSWSRARRAPVESPMPSAVRSPGRFIWGLPKLSPNDRGLCERGTCMLRYAFEYIRICHRVGIPGYLENPGSSMMFTVPEFKVLEDAGIIYFPKCDFCQYGTPWKKPTTFVTWLWKPELKQCHMCQGRCSHSGKKHVVLSGFQNKRFMTSYAQVYPRNLAKSLMGQMLNH